MKKLIVLLLLIALSTTAQERKNEERKNENVRYVFDAEQLQSVLKYQEQISIISYQFLNLIDAHKEVIDTTVINKNEKK